MFFVSEFLEFFHFIKIFSSLECLLDAMNAKYVIALHYRHSSLVAVPQGSHYVKRLRIFTVLVTGFKNSLKQGMRRHSSAVLRYETTLLLFCLIFKHGHSLL